MSAIAVEDVEFGDRIRPDGWHGFCRALDAEDMGDGWVMIRWEVLDHNAVGPYTMFQRGEVVDRA